MRLQELIQINEVTAFQEKTLMEHDWRNSRQVIGWLRSKGFKQKGSGAFSTAFVHPRYNRIVKISKKQDICWLRFAHWTLKMTTNPSVPYIDWVRVYGKDDKFFIAVIEKLAKYNKTAIMNTVDLPGLAYLYVYEDWFQGDETIEERFIKEGILKETEDTSGYVEIKGSPKNQLRTWLKNVRGGKRFINALRSSKKAATGGCTYDMHDGNLMYRPSDRRLVVIDPLADLSEIGFYF